jgi:hypothetical protein
MKDMQEGAHPKKKKKSVAGQFATVKYRSETYSWTQKPALVYPVIFLV